MNTAKTSTIAALFLSIVVALGGCASTKTSESTGEFIDDTVLTANVKTALLADKTTPGMSIQVESFKGKVQLSGFVNTKEQAQKAEEVASRVKGVKSVINKIDVKSSN